MSRAPVDATRHFESTAYNTFRLVPDPPLFVKGKGAWLFDEAGRGYLDLVCGAATTALGHGHPALDAAIRRELDSGILHTGTRLPSRARARLYEALALIVPARLDSFHLVNSGSEAIETAMKAAIRATGARRFIAFEGGYHGRTLGALSVTHAPNLREPFLATSQDVTFLPYPGHGETGEATLRALEHELARMQGDGTPVAAILFEAVQGVSGVVAPCPGVWQGVESLARAHDVLLIADEIWSGFGRTGKMFSFEPAGIDPDFVVMGKALSGSLPLSAVAAPSDILKAWPPGIHTSTFQGNPLAAAAAEASIRTILDGRLVERARDVIAPALSGELAALADMHDVRVTGAQAAIDMGSAAAAQELQRDALQAGLVVYGGGRGGECVMLVPPLVIEEPDLRAALQTLVKLAMSRG